MSDQKKEDEKTSNEVEKTKNTEEKVKKKILKRENKQLLGFIFVILFVFVIFLGPYFYFQNQKVFDFAGVTWQVEKDGEVTFYHTRFEKIIQGKSYGFHNTFLRNNPKTNKIPVEMGNISFHKNLIITQTPEALDCERQILVTDSLYQITKAMPFITNVTVAVTNKEVANESRLMYATCDNKPEKTTVISVEKGDEAKIVQNKEKKCYTVTIKDCKDNLKTSERLIIEIIKQLNGL